MSSYRQSSFDPNAGASADSRPMRPFNWVQWVGAGFVVAGILVMLAVILGRLGWLPIDTKDMVPMVTSLCVLGTVLINSRRETIQTTPEAKRRRVIIILIAFAVCAIVAGAVIYFQGA